MPKTITLSFEIPADVDTPSETLLRMRDLLLEALLSFSDPQIGRRLSDTDRALVKALLTES